MKAVATTAWAPLAPLQRLPALDALRGFALLGIFLMNIEFFNHPFQDMNADDIDPALHGLDWLADAFVSVFVHGKFWILFSLMFGAGFGVMLAKAQANGRAFVPVYLRRSLVLLVFGLLHALLVWVGDILLTYAIGGLLLLFLWSLRRLWWSVLGGTSPARVAPMPAEKLAACGFVAYSLIPMLVLVVGLMMTVSNPPQSVPDAANGAEAVQQAQGLAQRWAAERDAAVVAYRDGDFAAATRQRVMDMEVYASQVLPAFTVMATGVFMLGAALVRTRLLRCPQDYAMELRWFAIAGFFAGLVLVLLEPALEGRGRMVSAIGSASGSFGALSMALAYAAGMLLLLQSRVGAVAQRWLAPAGRMALTNYLAQSVVSTLFFYGYGLGQWGMGRAWQVVFVLVVYALQLLLSRWWLARFRFGPMEWLWRSLTYLKLQPMRAA